MVLLIASCGTFGEDKVPAADAGPEAAPEAAADAAVDAACKGGRPGPLLCGSAACDLAGRKNTCCLKGLPSGDPECRTGLVNCPAAQQNCGSKADCIGALLCCSLEKNGGTACRETCTDDAICATDADCPAGQVCLQRGKKYWYCGGCP
jgi:Cys-rich repeat protein